MVSFIKKYFFLIFICSNFLHSSDLKKMSGIAMIIGNDVILDSDLKNSNNNKLHCNTDVIDDFIIQKLMLYYAKKDKSIQISDQELELKTQVFLSDMRKKYINQEEFLIQFENKNFLKELTEKIKNKQYIEKFYNKITEGIETSPEEVKYFFTKKQYKIPFFPKKICISYIIFHPKLSIINKKKIIYFLNKIKKEIHSDIDFSTKAILFSEDNLSALQGGLVKGMKINNLSKKFVDYVLSLKEGEISEPFETDLGFHLIKLDKKRKDDIDFRHILIKPKYSKYELHKTKSFAELFRKRILNKKIDLEKISDLLNQNNTIDVIVRNQVWLEENQLSKKMKKIFLFLKKGKITNPYKEIINGKEAFVMIKLLDKIPSKPVSFEKDYTILKNFVINIKKKEKIKNWAKEILKKTYYLKINC
ncbi:exotoxin [Blattabacterium sp. DPU]|uniref:peptidylprolyl isomerase n=1 Tax=Blattabacterium sp. DPU TaxID=2715232 RepID=UPI00140859E9|nr:peptidylprolyl isomerase [Blattabacterium sp. DPU]QIK16424.1 exotoxin [Blattabacterium sp. DPU]